MEPSRARIRPCARMNASRDGEIGRRSGLKIRRGQKPCGGSIPPPGTSNFGINRLRSLPSIPLVLRDTFQGRKGFAHEQTRVRLEVRSCWKEVALLQTCRWKKRKNQTRLGDRAWRGRAPSRRELLSSPLRWQ